MPFPYTRLRRLRNSSKIRDLVQETRLTPNDFMAPLFVVSGQNVRKEISSLPGQFHESVENIVEHAKKIRDLGIPSVLLFGLPDDKDPVGSSAMKDDGVIQRATEQIKKEIPELLLTTDLCFCEYTSHGHCGIVTEDGKLDNDASLKIVVEQTLSHARAGADIIAPSGMLDGCIASMRQGLDENNFEDVTLMAYAAKFASSYYGPFREAVNSAPEFGDRKTYQMNPANRREALREVEEDINEGADIVMVKPALSFLDIIREVKDSFLHPVACYNVSGEYAMVKAAGLKGWIDEEKVMMEMLLSMKRAGSDIIITYFAEDASRSLYS